MTPSNPAIGYAVCLRRVPPRTAAEYWGWRFSWAVVALSLAAFAAGFSIALAALIALGLGAAAAGVLWPRLGLFGIGIAVTLDSLARGYFDGEGWYRFNTLNYGLLLAALLFLPLVVRRSDIHVRLLLALGLMLGIELAVSPAPDLGLQHWLNALAPFGMLAYFERAGRDSRVWFWLGVVNGLLSAAGGLALFLLTTERGNPNVWSYFPMTGLLSVCLGFPFARARGGEKALLAALAAVNTVWIFLSGSRGTLFAAVPCLLFLLLLTPGVWRRAAAVAGCAAVMALAAMAFGDLREHALFRIEKLFDPAYSAAESTSGRSILAYGGWEVFRDNLLGVGTGGYAIAAAPIAAQAFKGNAMQAHSAWVKVLAENGIPGVLLLAAFVFSFAFAGWRRRRREAVLLGAMTAAVLAIAFLSTEFASKGLWFLAMGTSVLLNSRGGL